MSYRYIYTRLLYYRSIRLCLTSEIASLVLIFGLKGVPGLLQGNV